MAEKKCKKLGNRATKAERYEAHRAKMEMKAAREHTVAPNDWIYANLSKNHEFYGDTPAEHEARKNNS